MHSNYINFNWQEEYGTEPCSPLFFFCRGKVLLFFFSSKFTAWRAIELILVMY
jgi:hypothetical protein